jgi:hypothetical protein
MLLFHIVLHLSMWGFGCESSLPRVSLFPLVMENGRIYT